MIQTEAKPNGMPCPCCGVAGQPVKLRTLRTLLKPESAAQVREEKSYFFCSASCGGAPCDVVYFAPGSQIFLKTDLTVRVGSKESASPRPICYCFGHTVESIAAEIDGTGASTAAADIRRRMREEGCSCETKNPAGRCCLAAVEKFVREQLASSVQEEEVAKHQAGGGCGGG